MKTRLFTGTKSLPIEAFPEDAWIGYGGATWPRASGTHDVQKLYRRLGLLWRCVDIRMASITNVPWEVRRGDTVIWSSEDEDAPEQFQWFEDFPVLLGLTEAALCLRSEAFWFRQANRARTLGLQWLSPLSITPVWDQDNGLIGFRRQLNAQSMILSPEEVVYLWARDPMNETQPRTSPAAAAMSAAGVLYNVDQFVAGFFERGAVKATLLTVEGNPTPAEKERLKSWWQRFFSGVTKSWGAEVVSASVKPVIVGEGIAELSNTDLTGEKRSDLVATMGVPHSKIFSDAANFATAQQDNASFYRDTIIPECNLIARQVNKQLLEPMGYKLRFTPETMDVFQEDENARSQSFAAYVGAGLKPSIVAQILGLDLPEGIEYEDLDPEPVEVVQSPMDAPPPTENVTQNVTEDSPEDPSAMRATHLDKWRRKAQKRLDSGKSALCDFESDTLTPLEVAYIRQNLARASTKADVLAAFEPQEVGTDHSFFMQAGVITPDAWKAMILQLDPGDNEAEQKIRMSLERRSERNLRRAMNDLLDTMFPEGWGEFVDPQIEADRIHQRWLADQQLRDAVTRAVQESADLGVTVAISQMDNIGYGFDWTLAHIQARDWAQQYAGELITQLADTTRTATRQAIGRWVGNGEPLDSLISDLEPFFGAKRAARIASTEVTRAYHEGNVAAWRESGVVQRMEWATANDELVCPTCGPLNGKKAPLGGTFGGGLTPPAHPNCRCWTRPVID